MYVSVIEEAILAEAMGELRKYREENPHTGVYAYSTPVEMEI
jgi:hypothetical protein